MRGSIWKLSYYLIPFFFDMIYQSFPGSSAGNESAYDAGDQGSMPSSGRSPGGRNGNPLQYSCWKIPWIEEPGGLQSMGSES